MRAVLPLALLFALAGSAHAQQLTEPVSSDRATAVEARVAPVPAVQNLQAPTDVKPIQSAERRTADEVTTSVVAEEAVMRQDPRSRNWWWLVGAIVAGGIVLALIL
jgi:hypothetical protein